MDTLKERILIREELYEAVDSGTLEAGPRKLRLRKKDLFQGFTFLCIRPYNNVSVEQFQDLLLATGGIVVNLLDALAAEKKRWTISVTQADVYDYEIISHVVFRCERRRVFGCRKVFFVSAKSSLFWDVLVYQDTDVLFDSSVRPNNPSDVCYACDI
ncbi:hypothetical protein WH47_06933 [Habropoda laboriosa]|uniref:Uncharacterized protein n=1 Tax=Habropoda laboriosa TaxID=597456 RepID=A0A0L7QRQ9_9HYME|nr:hypothetical protein WH47_06933 [Habropoda laboriosa]